MATASAFNVTEGIEGMIECPPARKAARRGRQVAGGEDMSLSLPCPACLASLPCLLHCPVLQVLLHSQVGIQEVRMSHAMLLAGRGRPACPCPLCVCKWMMACLSLGTCHVMSVLSFLLSSLRKKINKTGRMEMDQRRPDLLLWSLSSPALSLSLSCLSCLACLPVPVPVASRLPCCLSSLPQQQ